MGTHARQQTCKVLEALQGKVHLLVTLNATFGDNVELHSYVR